ncbi:hypothetical protein BA065_02885 [Nanoarchaeota archaeon NZ13-N]|uniref:Coenzyme Q-binding protein COQ10 START domain-containing protein n=1 Tax=Candidatus Nanoclepta minutus TaxID=1940235 RepID=A0A397WMB0_9ARCH|nr:MAG: hypothetical protein BA065_02885 [Nanoarchaeota archaeon NZ13-N]RIB35215.1 MAG: hypothetical protein BXU00_02705 [Candidatus Nanoclepta minutus]
MPAQRIVDNLQFSYTGIIDFKRFYSELKNFWKIKDYIFVEKKHEEKINEDGSRAIKLEWECNKEVTDYAKYIFYCTIEAEKIKIIKKENFEYEYAENLKITINGDLDIDYDKYFGNKPFDVFLRVLFEKYLVSAEVKEHKKKVSGIADEFLNIAKNLTGSYK